MKLGTHTHSGPTQPATGNPVSVAGSRVGTTLMKTGKCGELNCNCLCQPGDDSSTGLVSFEASPGKTSRHRHLSRKELKNKNTLTAYEQITSHPSTWWSARKGRAVGFTLIELLVVIAIIAILAACYYRHYPSPKPRRRGSVHEQHQTTNARMETLR